MSTTICILITLLRGAVTAFDHRLVHVVLQLPDVNEIPDDYLEYPLCERAIEYWSKYLPDHIRSIGEMVEVKVGEISEVVIVHNEKR